MTRYKKQNSKALNNYPKYGFSIFNIIVSRYSQAIQNNRIAGHRMITINHIDEAYKRIQSQIIKTPLLCSDRLNNLLPFDLYLKADCLQRTGSFKFRGGCNAVFSISEANRPVIAFSSGNHAQAVALAAKLSGRDATIVMPEDAPKAKIQGTRDYGAEVVLYNRYTQSREEIGERLAAEKKAVLIKPFDDERVIAGQGTSGLEIAEQAKAFGITPTHFISCCGGGGLMAGTSIALAHHFPNISLYAAEPEDFDDTCRSLLSGKHEVNSSEARSICDAIVTPSPGKITFPILQHYGVKGLNASDKDALHAMRVAWSYFKITAEPGGAIALACALSERFLAQFAPNTPRRSVVVMLSGGNVDQEIFTQALATPLRF